MTLREAFERPAIEDMTQFEKVAYAFEDGLKGTMIKWYAGIIAYGIFIELIN